MTNFTDLPSMRALTDKQQQFVLQLTTDPFGSRSACAERAGYAPVSAAQVAHKLVRDPKIQLAVREVTLASANTLGPPVGFRALFDVASDPDHKDRVRAAAILLDRVGMAAIQKMEITHHDLTGDALIARIRELAQKHGLDETKLIGSNVVDGEYEVVETGASGGRSAGLEGIQQSVPGEGLTEHGQLLQEGRQGDGGGAGQCDDGGGA